ncbi:MAG TPA: DUF4157 domain-containing protein [Opitutaceae bacterium]|jgi:hypothetical protein|nr:DUF4157 domain-containing protein [Opitutaceae bacterium]
MPAAHAIARKKSSGPPKREPGTAVDNRPAEAFTLSPSPGACACGGGCPRCEAKAGSAAPVSLKIGPPGDVAEQEADEVAEQVMHTLHAAPPGDPGPNSKTDFRISPQATAATTGNSPAPSIVQDVLQSPGQELSAEARAMMEPRFGRSFADVQVHANTQAANSADAVNARAYTVGRHLVFGAGQYAPGTFAGRHLLAHELTHVAQSRAGSAAEATMLRRNPVTTDLPSVAQYEWTGTEQRKTNTRLNQAYVSLSYEPTNGEFTCSFHLRWRFPAAWAEPRRAAYIDDFVKVVKGAWENKFPLVKYDKGAATSTTAKVLLAFDHIRAPDMGNDTEYVNWLMNDQDPSHNMRWTMNVHDSFQYRDKVDAPGVHLDPGANSPQTVDTSAFKDKTYTSGAGGSLQPPPYQHYFDKGINPSQGSAPGGKYTQTTSAHEFGHMIGLADEYVMSADDYNDLSKAKGKPAADAELGKRKTASARIENVGGQVTRDAYGPFADFLHTLTAEDWRVQ